MEEGMMTMCRLSLLFWLSINDGGINIRDKNNKNNNDKKTKNNTKKQHETCRATERVPKKIPKCRDSPCLFCMFHGVKIVHMTDAFGFGFGVGFGSPSGPVTAQNTQNQTEGEFGFGFGSRLGPAKLLKH